MKSLRSGSFFDEKLFVRLLRPLRFLRWPRSMKRQFSEHIKWSNLAKKNFKFHALHGLKSAKKGIFFCVNKSDNYSVLF